MTTAFLVAAAGARRVPAPRAAVRRDPRRGRVRPRRRRPRSSTRASSRTRTTGLEKSSTSASGGCSRPGLPLPLGVNVARRDLGERAAASSRRCCASRSDAGSRTATRRSRTRCGSAAASTRRTADRFVGMYVNELTLRLRRRGPPRRSRELLRRAEAIGVYDRPVRVDFVRLERLTRQRPLACARRSILSAVRTPIGRYGGALVGRAARRSRGARDRGGGRARRRRSGRRSRTSTSAARTRRARTTATSRAWRRCSPGCRSRSPASRSTGSARPASPRSSARATR